MARPSRKRDLLELVKLFEIQFFVLELFIQFEKFKLLELFFELTEFIVELVVKLELIAVELILVLELE